MAYMSQEKKKEIAAELKKVLKGSGLKYSLGVHHHSTLYITIKSGPVDFITNYNKVMLEEKHILSQNPHWQPCKDYMQVNDYWYHEQFTGKALDLMKKIIKTMNKGNHDRSDIQTDYFDVGWYLSVNVGKWDKPYVVVK